MDRAARLTAGRRSILVRAMIFYALVVLSARLFNQGHAWIGSLFILACLGLPWLGRLPGVAQVLVIRRQGWHLALTLSLGYVLIFGLVLMAARHRAHAPLDWKKEIDFLLSQQVVVQWILALAEEFFFRGYLQEKVGAALWDRQRWGPLTRKNLMIALLFGLAHAISRPSLAALLIAAGGMCLGWLVERSGRSIWPAVLLHAVSNMAIAWLI